MPKTTKLGEDAEIYKIREEQTEKEKLRDMPFKKKLSYLWEYYRIHALVFIIVVAMGSYLVYTILKPNIETRFYAAIINNPMDETVVSDYEAKFKEYLQIDPETETVIFNPSFYFTTDVYTMDLKTVLSAFIASQDLDVIIAPESEFKEYAYNGIFDPLSDQLPTDLYSQLTEYLYLSDQEGDPEPKVAGIYLNESELYKDYTYNGEPYVLGIILNSERKEAAVEFIRFLFNMK